MTLMERLRGVFAQRRSQPNEEYSSAIARIPVRRANIVVTHEKALELSACFGCVRVISEDIAKLPWPVFMRDGNKRRKLDNSRLYRILNTRPNPQTSSFTFRETLVAHALTYGNGYAEIERDAQGQVVALWPITPDRVTPRRDGGGVYYEVCNYTGADTTIEQENMFHLHGMGFDGLCGYSMIGLAAQSLGFGIAAEEHGSGFYGNNTTPGVAFKVDGTLTDEGFDRLQKQLDERKGSKYAYEGMIMEHGMDFARPAMSQVDAQYVETRHLIVEEVCRWWRVPPHKLGELSRAHFNNIEQQNIHYVTDALMPWAKRLEEEADWKLIGSRSQISYTKVALNGLMRGDSGARANFYKEMFHMGAYSQNDIRAFEDMDPIPNGDNHWIQSQYVTLDKAATQEVSQPPTPMDAAQNVLNNTVQRLFSTQLKKAQDAQIRLSQWEDQYSAWVTELQKSSSTRVHRAFADICETLMVGYGVDVDVQLLSSDYCALEEEQLLALFHGENPNADGIIETLARSVCKSK